MVVVGFNLLADGLYGTLDPHPRNRLGDPR